MKPLDFLSTELTHSTVRPVALYIMLFSDVSTMAGPKQRRSSKNAAAARRTAIQSERRLHSLVSLTPIAKPDSYDFLVEMQSASNCGDLLRRRLRVSLEFDLEKVFGAQAYRCPPLATPVYAA